MEYLDFEMRLSTANEGAHRVEVLRSPAGEIRAKLNLPGGEQGLSHCFEVLERSRKETGRTRKAVPGNPRKGGQEVARKVETLGQELFEALMPTEILAGYRTSLNEARKRGKGLRLRLRIESPELATLPWEYIYDEAEGDFVCLSTETPFLRYLESGRPSPPLTIGPPLRILGVVASPRDFSELDVVGEKRLIAEAVKPLVDAGHVSLTWLGGQTWRDLQEAMLSGPWHVLHFIGHGGFNEEKGEGLIILADEGGRSRRLGATELGRLVAGHQSIRLVVLNACEGARASTSHIFSSTGSVLIRRGVPAVVSMQYEITDRAALEFTRCFYKTLAGHLPIDRAVKEARKAISVALPETTEWATPVLHMRAPDGHLFDIDIAGAIFPAARKAKESIPSQPPSAGPLQPLSTDESTRRGLQILLQKVKKFWVDGMLTQSLDRSALIDLGLDSLPAMVDSPWGSLPMPSDQAIQGVLEEMGGSLLILGEPGAGKTTLMLRLARDLIAEAEADPGRPVPVVLNLSSWSRSGKPIASWIVSELSAKYQIPRRVSRSWVDACRLLLLLDGLDEVHADQRSPCIEAVNALTTEASLTSIVICCRLKEYIALPTRLMLNGAVRLRQLSVEQVLAHVDQAGPKLTGLRRALERDSALMSLAETPFMLNLMARTYRDLPTEALGSEELSTIEARRQQLIQAYVELQFRLAATGNP